MRDKSLKIGKGLTLPIDFITWTVAILARKRVGKTYLASVIAEEMVAAGLPFVVLDPTGAWWGLRASADGKGPGLPVVIIGGDHGDIPLEPGAGQVIADLVVEHPGYYIIDQSLTNSDAEQLRFAADFFSRIYRRKASMKYRDPLMVWVDEADAYAPQQPMKEEIRCLHHLKTAVRRGGVRGIGVGMISQRSAELNKGVLTQAEALMVLQITAPQDQDAVELWVKRHGTPELRAEFMNSLSSLQKGDAWIWHPTSDIKLKRFRARERKTFNSSATPEVGARRVEPKQLAKVDLEKIKGQVAATIERAQAEDPRALRAELAKRQARIAELERQVKTISLAPRGERIGEGRTSPKPATKAVPILMDKQFAQFDKAADKVKKVLELAIKRDESVKSVAFALATMSDELFKVGRIKEVIKRSQPQFEPVSTSMSGKPIVLVKKETAFGLQPSAYGRPSLSPSDSALSTYALGLIGTLAKRHPMQMTRGQMAVLSGRSLRSSAFSGAVVEILRSGLVVQKGKMFSLTEQGIAVSDVNSAPPNAEETRETWRRALPSYQRELLDVLVSIYPEGISREDLAQRAGKSIKSSAFSGAVVSLKNNGLAEESDKVLTASRFLFE